MDDSPQGDRTTSKTTATLSPPMALLLRGALHTELGQACEDAPQVKPESTRAGWTTVVRRLNSAVHGLDLLGWEDPDEQHPVTIALDAAMIEALETDADHYGWASQTESGEGRERAASHAATIERFSGASPSARRP